MATKGEGESGKVEVAKWVKHMIIEGVLSILTTRLLYFAKKEHIKNSLFSWDREFWLTFQNLYQQNVKTTQVTHFIHPYRSESSQKVILDGTEKL